MSSCSPVCILDPVMSISLSNATALSLLKVKGYILKRLNEYNYESQLGILMKTDLTLTALIPALRYSRVRSFQPHWNQPSSLSHLVEQSLDWGQILGPTLRITFSNY